VSEITKGRHEDVKTEFGARIDFRRRRGRKSHTKEMWTILQDPKWLPGVAKYRPIAKEVANDSDQATAQDADEPRRSGRLTKSNEPAKDPTPTLADGSGNPDAPQADTAPEPVASPANPSRKRKATGEDEDIDPALSKKRGNVARIPGDPLAQYGAELDQARNAVAPDRMPFDRPLPTDRPALNKSHQYNQNPTDGGEPMVQNDAIEQWRLGVSVSSAKAYTSIATLSDRVSEISFEDRYLIPRNSSRDQRIQFLATFRRRNREFGNARIGKHKAGAEERKAEAEERRAQFEAHLRDGEDAQLEYRIQIEQVDPEQPKEQVEDTDEAELHVPSGPQVAERMEALVNAAGVVTKELRQEGEDAAEEV